MKMGLLWYDADPKRPAVRKIDEAVEHYCQKFGVAPNTCYVNPKEAVSHPSLKVVPKPIVQPNHYLVGVAGTMD
ncbi:MAG: hypothetical protein HYX94_04695 [Chloroflexi bacterium]|nr:hypothetical protein [Chloroflexota bacterium]